MEKKFAKLINGHLGGRASNAEYSYSDLVLSMCYTALCGGDCAEDINEVRSAFAPLKGLKVASADRILGIQKELATPIEALLSDNGNTNKINVNDSLNGLMVRSAIHFGLLDSKATGYTLDFDHQFIPTEKYDAGYSYKNRRGYFPGVASIDNIPVYVENRNGNCHVSFNQLATIKRIAKVLDDNDINPACWRMDSGSYIKEVCDYIHEELGALFYIRADRCNTLLFEAANCEAGWTGCRIGFNNYEVNSFDYQFGKHKHRIVAHRWSNKTGQGNIITGDAFRYLFIITNDRVSSGKEVIQCYNQRVIQNGCSIFRTMILIGRSCLLVICITIRYTCC